MPLFIMKYDIVQVSAVGALARVNTRNQIFYDLSTQTGQNTRNLIFDVDLQLL